jgi:hypothetical protein
MKIKLAILGGWIGILISSYSFGCEDQNDCQQSVCSESQNYCQCADVNCGSSSCLNKNACCQLFGNVGNNHLSD